jgi:low affinity Fe/Cu permease
MFERFFTRFANAVARWTGKPAVFLAGCLGVVTWALAGPMFHFSDTWQLLINTSTTIVTFLMVLLIQNTQNRDNAAIQAKLDELIRATESRNHFIGLEHQTETEIGHVRQEVEQHADVQDDVADAKADTKEAKQITAKAEKVASIAKKLATEKARNSVTRENLRR